ncbi:MAG TPA: serine--tRNA ligase [Dictyoglomaceae bacterium]|nr:serine--tRNA ligase [Dictyoglomaceae bacterium]HOL39613.1 serine--tRNA ligase [Dictyoglomaceae bacterium]HOP95165.1 serine--tRNA ligase [Dictyoglomaceae bacterium]HPP15185.1 serine--tRNA ligase [Dictyoglomaceae bacterium]HPU42591.1 serine--tRNA ligase [Dictyoglomaceae bacterium]
MIDIKILRENPGKMKENIISRNLDPQKYNVDYILNLDIKRRELQKEVDNLRAQRNKISQEVGRAEGKEKEKLIQQAKEIKESIEKLEKEFNMVEKELFSALWQLPNFLSSKAPIGKDDSDNKEIKKWGNLPSFSFSPKDHLELGLINDLLDFERGGKVTGSNFYYLKNESVILEFALIQFVIDTLVSESFKLFITPDLAKMEVIEGIGFQPRGPEAQIYKVEDTDLGLIATAEITLGGYHKDEILDELDLPLKYLGFSHCFRTEAGAYGKYNRGLYRVHQFSKVEIFIICKPEDSEDMHEYILSLEEKIFQKLEIPYRVLDICSGDLGAPAARKFDIEAWMPGRGEYGEVTSCSNCTDYQARRLNIRFRRVTGELDYAHTLNGTAIAISRALIAIFENYQQEDGRIIVPKVLQPYTLGIKELTPKR